MEPSSGVPLQCGDLLLGRPPFGHERALALKVSLTLYVLLHVEVGQAGEPPVQVANRGAKVADSGSGHLSRFPLVLVGQREHLLRPRLRHGVAGEQGRQLGFQLLLAQIALLAGPALLGATVVDVAVDVAVLLPLGYRLGGYRAAALAAFDEAAQGLRLLAGFLRMSAPLKHGLHAVEQFLGDDRRMRALVYLSGVLKVANVEGVGEDALHSIFRPRLSAAAPVAAAGANAPLVQKGGHVLKARLSLRVQLEGRKHEGRFAPVHVYPLGTRIVDVAYAGRAGVLTAPRLLLQTAFRVVRQGVDVILAHPEYKAKHELSLRRVLEIVGGELEVGDFAGIKVPDDVSAIHRISREAVGMPRQDALRFAPFDLVHQLVEDGAAGLLSRSFLGELLYNEKPLPLGELAEHRELVFDGAHLLVLDIGRFAGVEEVVHGYSIP